MEEIDSVKEQFPYVSAGLEIDFYPHRIDQIANFLDQYGNQFDLLIGSVHELEDFYPVTVRSTLSGLIEQYGSFQAVVDKYFQYEHELLESHLFDVIAHPNVVFRFVGEAERLEHPEYIDDPRLIELGTLCIETNTLMEVNASGFRYEWGNSLPSPAMVNHLRLMGVQFVVGSDSHFVEDFKDSILQIRQLNQLIKKRI